mmetsp:Transcript_58365/g.115840  ORF Transcript_58365/g.115840 Transcript_58365/m.115840 type:complete len:196 (-) Transcript_58365:172-759(-)
MKYRAWYWLFFAAGRFCMHDYSEGVARARSIWGPYEKLPVPLLSTGLVGAEGNAKLIGPGHAAFVTDASNGAMHVVYHASKGEAASAECIRHAFVDEIRATDDGWPYVAFSSASAHSASARQGQHLLASRQRQSVHMQAFEPRCRVVSSCGILSKELLKRPGIHSNGTWAEKVVCNGVQAVPIGHGRQDRAMCSR